MIGSIQNILQNNDFINEINIVVKSMIYIYQNRHAFFTNYTNLLYNINIEYNFVNNEGNNERNNNVYYENLIIDFVKIKNTFFSIGKNTLFLQNEYNVFSGNESILSGFLNDERYENYEFNGIINFALKQDVKKKIQKQHKKNMRIISKSYLRLYLLKMMKDIPEEIMIMILLYI